MTLRGSTVAYNTAQYLGGGVLNGSLISVGRLTVESSTISYNTAAQFRGGGIWNGPGSTVDVSNTTIVGNVAEYVEPVGSGNYNDGAATLANTVLAANLANGRSGPLRTVAATEPSSRWVTTSLGAHRVARRVERTARCRATPSGSTLPSGRTTSVA